MGQFVLLFTIYKLDAQRKAVRWRQSVLSDILDPGIDTRAERIYGSGDDRNNIIFDRGQRNFGYCDEAV